MTTEYILDLPSTLLWIGVSLANIIACIAMIKQSKSIVGYIFTALFTVLILIEYMTFTIMILMYKFTFFGTQ
jgi:hypothetical protein